MNSAKITQIIAKNILVDVDRVCRKNNIEYFICAGTLLGAIRHEGFIPWDDDIDIGMTRDNYNKFIKIAQKDLSKDFFVQTKQTDPKYNIFHVPLKVRDNHSRIIGDKQYDYNEGVFLDIFPMDYIPSNEKKRAIQKNIALLLSSSDSVLESSFKDLRLANKVLYPFHYFMAKIMPDRIKRKIVLSLLKLNGNDKEYIGYGLDSIWNVVFKTEDVLPIKEMQFDGMKVMGPSNPDALLLSEYGDYMKIPPESERMTHFSHIEVSDEYLKKIMDKNK